MSTHIVINNTVPRIRYVSNGVLSSYDFPFAIFKNSDLKVYFNSLLQEENTYTVTGVGQSDGGNVTLSVVPENGVVITLTRELPIERTTDFQEGGTLRADVLNYELDYQIACQQQLADSLNRSMILPPYAVDTNVSLSLPIPSAGKAIVWDAQGTKLENSTVAVNELESTLNEYKTTAQTAAQTATSQAQEATTQAQTATTQAQNALTQAQAAATQAQSATNQAQIATTQAGIATAKATEISTDLTGKANVALDNLSGSGRKKVSFLSLPGASSVDLTLNSSGSTYTAPANGYYYLCKSAATNKFVVIENTSKGYKATSLSTNNNQCLVFIAAQKNDVVKIDYTAAGSVEAFKFIYAQGELS